MTRIAINGFGRIGRAVLRLLADTSLPYRQTLTAVAVNDPAPADQLALLLGHDTVYGNAGFEVALTSPHQLQVGGDNIHISGFSQAADLPWSETNIDLVLECSGTLVDRKANQAHLKAGASRVLLSCPDGGDLDATVVFGVNHHLLTGKEQMISAASCTSNCLVPILALLDKAFGIRQGATTTLHAPMNDQPLVDSAAATDKDLRLIRSGSRCLTPTRTRLAEGVSRILPQLEGRLISHSVRLPGVAVSAMDMTLLLERPASAEEINQLVRTAAEGNLRGIVGLCDEPLVSEDFLGDSRSAIVDAAETAATAAGLVRLLVWFDNERAFAHRMLDLATHWSSLR